MLTTSGLLKMAFPKRTWSVQTDKKEIFLTFDDGPTPEITEWTLDLLKKHKAKATFFCLGKNVNQHPEIFKRCIDEGHSIGNHLYAHENGWKTSTTDYINSVKKTGRIFSEYNIKTRLLRPPYGKISQKQAIQLADEHYKLIMWNVLSKDYDTKTSPEKCLKNSIKNLQKGSIVVFHDSVKASTNMQFALPRLLEKFSKEGFKFEALQH